MAEPFTSSESRVVADLWRQELVSEGYERRVRTVVELERLRRLPRVWRRILRLTRIPPEAKLLEIGCGGGNQLVPLALRGFPCVGLDVSAEVLRRCRAFVEDVEALLGTPLPIELYQRDFFQEPLADQYDLVFEFGVIEHFLQEEMRLAFQRRMRASCRPGGWAVNVVPSGVHPLRERMRAEGLGGYRVPEVDYSCESLRWEMIAAGFIDVVVRPHDLLGYRSIVPDRSPLRRAIDGTAHKLARLLPAVETSLLSRYATSIIAAGRRPVARRDDGFEQQGVEQIHGARIGRRRVWAPA